MMSLTPRIKEKLTWLKQNRSAELIHLFNEAALLGKKIQVNFKSISGTVLIGLSDKVESGNDFNSWRFKTSAKNYSAMYHERWILDKKDVYFLERAYFHLYKNDSETLVEKEYILLHCDASEPIGTPHSEYKQSPHLHIECAEHPIPKAHIALFNGQTEEVLSDLKSFNQAIAHSMSMINSQIISKL